MENSYVPKYDESKECEVIFDFHNSQIWRVNTDNANLFLEVGEKFDKGLLERLDEKGRCRLIYIVDKVPPLSAILKHIENPFPVQWAVLAIVIPKNSPIYANINPIIKYGLGLTKFKDKYKVGVFDYSHRDNLKEVIEWMDSNMEIKVSEQPVEYI